MLASNTSSVQIVKVYVLSRLFLPLFSQPPSCGGGGSKWLEEYSPLNLISDRNSRESQLSRGITWAKSFCKSTRPIITARRVLGLTLNIGVDALPSTPLLINPSSSPWINPYNPPHPPLIIQPINSPLSTSPPPYKGFTLPTPSSCRCLSSLVFFKHCNWSWNFWSCSDVFSTVSPFASAAACSASAASCRSIKCCILSRRMDMDAYSSSYGK